MEFYDVGTSDLRELWDSFIVESSLGQDVLMGKDDDWTITCGKQANSFGVVLRDRLMTDAALGGPKPIKAEHSYSMPVISNGVVASNMLVPCQKGQQQQKCQQQPKVTVEAVFPIVCASETGRIDDMEEECFPAISMNTASGRDSSRCSTPEPFAVTTTSEEADEEMTRCNITVEDVDIKGEPLSQPQSPCTVVSDPAILLEERNSSVAISPHSLHLTDMASTQTSDSEDEEDETHQTYNVETYELTCEDDAAADQTSNQELPPTPPSSASSDSEGTVSASCSPERRDSHGSVHVQNLRGFLQPRLYVTTNGTLSQHATSTRQPIHTPLISCQPKGSTGILVLTEEEKRTLVAEGFPIPTKLPLTKQEEKSLKKVRRKIKNKISAQESRRKKKEYMDGLERRVTLLTNENTSYREKLTNLENTNRQLLKELQRLQAMIQKKSS